MSLDVKARGVKLEAINLSSICDGKAFFAPFCLFHEMILILGLTGLCSLSAAVKAAF